MYSQIWMLLYGITSVISAQSSMVSIPSFRRYDYTESNLPMDYTGLRDVQQYNTLFSYALSRQVLDNLVEEDQCPLDISRLEQSLAQSMSKARLELGDKELEGFGNKHANLVKMADLLNALDITDINVPMPQGISSIQIQHFLEEEVSDIFQKWDELKDLAAKHPFENILENSEFQRILNEIDKQIETAFSSETAYDKLHLSNDMEAWIRALADTHLMVRSTGAEDSNSTANAGGNMSAAYVSPDKKSLSNAIGRVVRSYFGASSLQNRINAGLNPFEDELKLAVTVQELIGEPVGGAANPNNIPVSFVLFTHEPLYVDVAKEQFRVMRLSATYGHGEAVVSNQGIGTDSILLLRSESNPNEIYYIYDNQHKTERLAPILDSNGEVHLGKIKNPASLAHKQTFTTEQLHGIYQAGILMESFFENRPTDIEGVVKGGQLHFVQARPVNRQPLLPTYINKSSSNKIQAETLVIGKGSAIKITHKNEVLLAATLEEAEKKFKMNQHKLVIVTHPEPENSHPVVNFSGLGIPCLYAPHDTDQVKQFINQVNENHPLAVCMQTASLSVWEDATTLDEHIIEGFAVHPAKIALSLPSSHTLSIPSASTEPEFKTLLTNLREAKTTTEALDALQLLENQPQIKQLSEKIQAISSFTHSTEGIENYLQTLNDLNTLITRSIAETRATLQKQAPAARLPALFNIKTLETVILGSPKKSARQSAYSLSDSKAIFTAIATLIDYQNQLSHPAHCIDILLLAKQETGETFSHWRSFLLELEPLIERNEITQEELTQFETLINSLAKSETLSVWLTFFQFQEGSAIEQLHATLNILTPSNQAFIQDIQEDRSYFVHMRDDPTRFADPKTGASAWNELQTYIEKYTSEDWLKTATNAPSLTKMMASQLMECAVDCLDLAAKAVKSSPQLTEIDRIKQFKAMLLPYFKLMDTWSHTFISPETLEEWDNNSRYFRKIQTILTELPSDDEKQLHPSRGFSVAAAMIGSRANFHRHQPQTLEDILTLLHQNILVTINSLNQGLLTPQQINTSLLPISIKKIMQEVDNVSLVQIQRIGMHISQKEIALQYNVPLSSHSGKIEIHYDRDSNDITFKGHFLGEARNRWYELGDWITFLEKHKIFEANHPLVIRESALAFSWKISPETLNEALTKYAKMAAYTLDYTLSYPYKDATLALLQNEEREALIAHIKSTTNLVQEGKNIETGMKLAADNIHNWRKDIYSPTLDLYIALLETGQGFEAATAAATEGITSPDKTKSQSHDFLNLFKALFETGQGFEAAITAATETIKTPDKELFSLALFKALFEKEQGFEAAITTATETIKPPHKEHFALALFKALFEKGQGFEAAITTATEGIESPDKEHFSLALFKALFEKGQGFEAAITTATEGIKSPDNSTKQFALKLFNLLVEKEQSFEAAITAATEGIKSPDISAKQFALALFKALFEKGEGFEAAITAATEGIKSPDISTKQFALALFNALVKKEQGFEAAITAATEGIKSSDISTKQFALDLFHALVKKEQGFEAAITAATEGIKSSDISTKQFALDLFHALVKKEQGFEAAITAATEGIISDNQLKKLASLELLKILKKEEGFTPSLAAAREDIYIYQTHLIPQNLLEALIQHKDLLPDACRNDQALLLTIIKNNPKFILCASDVLQTDQAFLLSAMQENYKVIWFVPEAYGHSLLKTGVQAASNSFKMIMDYKAKLLEIMPQNLSEEQCKKIDNLIDKINDQIEGSSSTQYKKKMQAHITMLEEFNKLAQTIEPSSAVEKIKEDIRFQQIMLETGSRSVELIEEIAAECKKYGLNNN